MTATVAVGLILILAVIVCACVAGYYRRDRAELVAAFKKAKLDVIRANTELKRAKRAHDDQAVLLTVAQAEIERYDLALRGSLQAQAQREARI